MVEKAQDWTSKPKGMSVINKRAHQNLGMSAKNNFLALFFLFFIPSMAFAQDTIPYLTATDIGNNRAISFIRLKANELDKYKGLDQEILLEYGLKELIIQEIIQKSTVIRVEFYMMKDSAASFGLFSIKRRKCTKTGIITRFDCVSMKNTQFVMGKMYVNIEAHTSSEEAGVLCETLGKTIIRKLFFRDWDYPRFFDYAPFYPYLSKLLLINGPEGFLSAFPDWEEKFRGLKFEAVLIPAEFKAGSCTVGKISFKTAIERDRFLNMNGLTAQSSSGAFTLTKGKIRQFAMISGIKELLYAETWGNTNEVDKFRFEAEQRIRNFTKGEK